GGGQNASHKCLLPLPHQATIQLDIDPAELGRTFRPSVALSGDARATLAALLREVPRRRRPSWRAECARVAGEAAAVRAAEEASEAVPGAPPRVMAALAAPLRPRDLVAGDAGLHARS